jgi:hypothetical protein
MSVLGEVAKLRFAATFEVEAFGVRDRSVAAERDAFICRVDVISLA